MKHLLKLCILIPLSAFAGVYDYDGEPGLDSAYKLYGYDGDPGLDSSKKLYDNNQGNSLDSSSKLQPRQDSSNQQRYDGDGVLKPQKLKKYKIIRSY
jgi:hypothetical protein